MNPSLLVGIIIRGCRILTALETIGNIGFDCLLKFKLHLQIKHTMSSCNIDFRTSLYLIGNLRAYLLPIKPQTNCWTWILLVRVKLRRQWYSSPAKGGNLTIFLYCGLGLTCIYVQLIQAGLGAGMATFYWVLFIWLAWVLGLQDLWLLRVCLRLKFRLNW